MSRTGRVECGVLQATILRTLLFLVDSRMTWYWISITMTKDINIQSKSGFPVYILASEILQWLSIMQLNIMKILNIKS